MRQRYMYVPNLTQDAYTKALTAWNILGVALG